MVHLVYCDNTGKKGEKVLDKILAGTKIMVVRGQQGEKFPIAGFLRESGFTLWKKEVQR